MHTSVASAGPVEADYRSRTYGHKQALFSHLAAHSIPRAYAFDYEGDAHARKVSLV